MANDPSGVGIANPAVADTPQPHAQAAQQPSQAHGKVASDATSHQDAAQNTTAAAPHEGAISGLINQVGQTVHPTQTGQPTQATHAGQPTTQATDSTQAHHAAAQDTTAAPHQGGAISGLISQVGQAGACQPG